MAGSNSNEGKWGSRETFFSPTGEGSGLAEEAITPSFVQTVVISPMRGFIDKLQRINVIRPTEDSELGANVLIATEKEICAQMSLTFQKNTDPEEISKEDNSSLKNIYKNYL
jgi:hypothetical protein